MKLIKLIVLLLIALPILYSCDTTTEPDTVATPVISPISGDYTSAQSVTITCATADAVIRYTMDGTSPDSSATAITYTSPINVTSNKIIKAIAKKTGWTNSLIVTAEFMIYNEMTSFSSGTFTMGRASGTGYPDELPTHAVTISRDFYMGKYEVTQAEWTAIMGTNPSTFVGTTKPVEEVSFYSVLAYCNKRSMAEGLTPVYTISGSTNPAVWGAIPTTNNVAWNAAICSWNANGYRLPSEAEWEYAARGATNTPDYMYSGSDTIGDVAWYDVNSSNQTHVVGAKAANGSGAFDMSGNVQEWVWDWYNETYYGSSPSTDPYGPATGTWRVIRGGSWEQEASFSRVPFRNQGTPEKGDGKVSNSRLGFRVVRTAE